MTTNKKYQVLRLLLLPFSFLYGIGVFLRNLAFDIKIIKSKSFQIPIISVGNLTVGGTGKTPLIESLIDMLQQDNKVAVLSRGYQRKTKGFIIAGKKATPKKIGDEPYQIYKKYDTITVAVSEKRVEGVEKLIERKKKLNVVLLDDAYQHRYIKPGLSILLIDYNRPVFKDFLLPAGNLREGFSGKKRAHIIVITKCPYEPDNETVNYWKKKLKPARSQSLFFSSISYGQPLQVFAKNLQEIPLVTFQKQNFKVLLVTGIANPQSLINYLDKEKIHFETIIFPDHHQFNHEDILKIKKKFKSIPGRKKAIFTTEKDAVRFQHIKKFPVSLKHKFFYIPISNKILNGKQNEFESLISNYVKKNK